MKIIRISIISFERSFDCLKTDLYPKPKMRTKTLNQIKNQYYGEAGTPERDRIERDLDALRIGLKIRTAREQKEMTQAQLADRIDKKRTFISKVENDGENITLKTLFDIVERGLGGKLNIEVRL